MSVIGLQWNVAPSVGLNAWGIEWSWCLPKPPEPVFSEQSSYVFGYDQEPYITPGLHGVCYRKIISRVDAGVPVLLDSTLADTRDDRRAHQWAQARLRCGRWRPRFALQSDPMVLMANVAACYAVAPRTPQCSERHLPGLDYDDGDARLSLVAMGMVSGDVVLALITATPVGSPAMLVLNAKKGG